MDLNKHLAAPVQDIETFHSNGFARAAGGDRVGAASKETFAQRRQVDSGRSVVDGYRFSNMGRNYASLKARPIMPAVQAPMPEPPRPPGNPI